MPRSKRSKEPAAAVSGVSPPKSIAFYKKLQARQLDGLLVQHGLSTEGSHMARAKRLHEALKTRGVQPSVSTADAGCVSAPSFSAEQVAQISTIVRQAISDHNQKDGTSSSPAASTESAQATVPDDLLLDLDAAMSEEVSVPKANVQSPPLSDSLVAKIVAGEFIDLNKVLSELTCDSQPVNQGFKVSGEGDALTLQPTDLGRLRRVVDITSWLEAYSAYAFYVADNAPHRSTELWKYQMTIVKAAARYGFGAWSGYDIALRTQVARSQGSLATVDQDLWSEWFTNALLPACRICNVQGHLTIRCPKSRRNESSVGWSRAGSATLPNGSPLRVGGPLMARGRAAPSPSPAVGSASAVPTSTSLATPLVSAPCRDFNRNTCFRSSCRFSHCCSSCLGSHRAPECPSRPAAN